MNQVIGRIRIPAQSTSKDKPGTGPSIGPIILQNRTLDHPVWGQRVFIEKSHLGAPVCSESPIPG